jgi:cation transport ATPase
MARGLHVQEDRQMKHYKIENGNLIMTDSSKMVLMMPHLAVGLTMISMSLALIGRIPLEFDFMTMAILLTLIAAVVVFVWAFIKKSYWSELPVKDIKMIKLSSVNKSGFYLQLKNGRQRDLAEVKNVYKGVELLIILREENPAITANFSEEQFTTR